MSTPPVDDVGVAADPAAPMTGRQRLMWKLFDFSVGRGLEIGPLHQTAVPRDRGDVRYLDVFDREQLLVNYGDNPGVPCELIPEIDYALFDGDRVRSIPEAIGDDDRFDWVLASHVVEHVPDVIGWLDQVAQVTADGGHLVLAVPDRRYCFDLHRPGTTVGQMIQANEAGDVVPSVRAVYDYKRGHASVKAPVIWGGKPPGYEQRIYKLDTVLEQVDKARSGEYIDSHVWTFTPGSFLEQIVELRLIGHSEWKVVSLTPTKRNELEFYAVLQRLPRGGNWTPEQLGGEPALPNIPDWLAESSSVVHELEVARDRIARLEKENADLRRPARARLLAAAKARARTSPAGPTLQRVYRRLRRTARR